MTVLLLGLMFTLFQSSGQKSTATENFRIIYDRSVSSKEISPIGKSLEEEYSRQQKKLGMSFSRKIVVYVFNSEQRYKSQSKSLAFDDADAKSGKIYLSLAVIKKRAEDRQNILARVVVKALLSEIPFSPPWLNDAYGLYAGQETGRFGDPARMNIASFGDLFEEYNRAERPRDVKEVYAKLGVTIDFLIDKYGEEKVKETFVEFKTGKAPETVFASVFGENIQAIEQAWVSALRATLKQ